MRALPCSASRWTWIAVLVATGMALAGLWLVGSRPNPWIAFATGGLGGVWISSILWGCAFRKRMDRESFLRAISDAVPGAVGYWDAKLVCRFANPGYLEHFGKPPDQILGMGMRDLLGEGLFERIRPMIEAALSGEMRRFESTLLHPDGTKTIAIVQYTPHKVDGKVVGFFVIATDVTSLKLAERRLEAMNSQLEERTRQAEEANRVKGEFLANVSHEIRTPLNSVIGMTALLLDGEFDPEKRHGLEIVLGGGEALLSLLDEILDLSKIESGRFQIESVPFDPRKVVDQVRDLMQPRARTKAIDIFCYVDAFVPSLAKGDPVRLRQVLLNLVGNAIKFTHQGSIRVRIEAQMLESKDVRLRASVRDTGIGIPPDRIRDVFEKFTQVDASTTRRFGGTGLGLAICNELVTRMGGEMGVESELGKGSDFWFTATLQPCHPEDAHSSDSVASAAELHRKSHRIGRAAPRILVADDNAANRAVALGLLRKAGCVGVPVTHGAEALELLAREGFDLVLMDVQMPEVDGLEATRRLRSTGFAGPRNDMPVIALTASAMEADRLRCLEAGMDDFLSKPLFYKSLVEALDRWIPDREGDPLSAPGFPE